MTLEITPKIHFLILMDQRRLAPTNACGCRWMFPPQLPCWLDISGPLSVLLCQMTRPPQAEVSWPSSKQHLLHLFRVFVRSWFCFHVYIFKINTLLDNSPLCLFQCPFLVLPKADAALPLFARPLTKPSSLTLPKPLTLPSTFVNYFDFFLALDIAKIIK